MLTGKKASGKKLKLKKETIKDLDAQRTVKGGAIMTAANCLARGTGAGGAIAPTGATVAVCVSAKCALG